MDKKEKRKFFQKIRDKYRFSVYRDESYEEVLNLRLSRMNVIAWGGIVTLLFLGIVISIIVYTPVREFIPGYPDENTLKNSSPSGIINPSPTRGILLQPTTVIVQ